MALPFSGLFNDAPPAFAFEISEAGVAFAPTSGSAQPAFREFEPGVISVSPLKDNIQKPEKFSAQVASLFPSAAKSKRRTAALILPDYSARVQVIDFDTLPSAAEEELALIRFRLKKTVPFDVESAVVSYQVQPAVNGKIEVIAAIIALEIVARYEAPFRAAGYQPGLITTSALAALNLTPSAGLMMLAKLSGNALSVMVLDGTRLKLAPSCVELEQVSSEEMLGVLHPTLAYIEDELHTRPGKLLLCGFGREADQWARAWQADLGLPVEPLQSQFGSPGPHNAGLLGYLANPGVSR